MIAAKLQFIHVARDAFQDIKLNPLQLLQVESFDERGHDFTTFLLVEVHDLLSNNGDVYIVVSSECCTRPSMH